MTAYQDSIDQEGDNPRRNFAWYVCGSTGIAFIVDESKRTYTWDS